MLFEIVITQKDEILFDEKIVADTRDQALIKLGRRLEQEEIESDNATVMIRQFTVSNVLQTGIPQGGITLVGTTGTNTGTVVSSPFWTTSTSVSTT